jgi:NAD(P)-dependent dehydrogenase (short-subunit alcohol dehydrogenase family)
MPLLNTSMQGKVCLITGANSGIGKATALGLAQMGATVVMVCRDRARGEEAQREIKTESGNDAVDLLLADLSSQQSIRQLADIFRQRYTHLHVLINNAGAGFTQRRESVDGLEMTFAVNYLAPFLLTNSLLDVLKNSAPARIINVDSDNHRFVRLDMHDLQLQHRYGFLRAYGRSKLALLLFTYELARQQYGTGITVNALEPGPTATNFGQKDAGLLARTLLRFISSRFGSPEEGAQTSIYLASSPVVETITGKYFVKSVPRRSSARSYDESLQRQLWEESAKLVQLPAKIHANYRR